MMKVLFVGGTGLISVEVSKLAIERGIDLYLLNRGQRNITIEGAKSLVADITKPEQIASVLEGHHFDCVVNWIVFHPDEIRRDIELFRDKCNHYIFISSASAYQKPLTHPVVTESTPLANPYWEYSRNKIACEEALMLAYRQEGFPMTIVRPSHTYDKQMIVSVGDSGAYGVARRMLEGKPVIVHGDGTSLWTLTHSKDFAIGFVGLLANPQTIGQSFHITSDYSLTWNQIYEHLADALNVKANIVHMPSEFIAQHHPDLGAGLLGDKMWSVIFDNSKIKRFVPDYVAKIPYHIGLEWAVNWFQAEDSRMQVTGEDDALIDGLLEAYGHRL